MPWLSGSNFSLQHGSNRLHSEGDLIDAHVINPGEYVYIDGNEYTICLHDYETDFSNSTSISLCSAANTNFPIHSNKTASHLFVYKLDTSVGPFFRPQFGRSVLKMQDANSIPDSILKNMNRGDYIRVGHPYDGEDFRISLDINKVFNAQNIPLGAVDDPTFDASLSFKALQHASYEVQVVTIKATIEAGELTPSNVASSGFRLKFGDEITSTTTSGGESGCIRWDATSEELRDELQSLPNIDYVNVSSREIAFVENVTGGGKAYSITFSGNLVRGDVDLLEVIDIGKNGCFDSSIYNGTFLTGLDNVSISKERFSTVPVYTMQRTSQIPYNATDKDVKAALEELSLVCKVNVERFPRLNGFIWDVTFLSQHCQDCPACKSARKLIGNNVGLEAEMEPNLSIIGLKKVTLPVSPTSSHFFARLSAKNSFGVGPSTSSYPISTKALRQVPGQVGDLVIGVISNSEVLVQWESPPYPMGEDVTHYKVDFDISSDFNSGVNNNPIGSLFVSAQSDSSIYDVQSITVGKNSNKYIDGSFILNFDGQKTEHIKVDASAEEVEKALEELCTIDDVTVSRHLDCSITAPNDCKRPQQYTWMVTFVSATNSGNQHPLFISKHMSHRGHRLQIENIFLRECSDITLQDCVPIVEKLGFVGSTPEVQQFTMGLLPFRLSFKGQVTDLISSSSGLQKLKSELESISIKTDVSCSSCFDGNLAVGDVINITLLSVNGDAPPLIHSDENVSVIEIRKGSFQPVVGQASYSIVVPNLSSMHDWHFRVQAYNSLGSGPPTKSWPETIRPFLSHPTVAKNVTLSTGESATSLRLTWNEPMSDGGTSIVAFEIDADTTPSFSSKNGEPLVSYQVSAIDADASLGTITIAYPNHDDPFLRKTVLLSEARLVLEKVIHVGSQLYFEGKQYEVISLNRQNCGISCLTLDKAYEGNLSSGIKFNLGRDQFSYMNVIKNLTPGVSYYARVSAISQNNMKGPHAFYGYPFYPKSVVPGSPPLHVREATLSFNASDSLRVEISPSSNERAEGNNGSPVSRYLFQVGTRENEVQQLTLSSDNQLMAGEFRLSLGMHYTRCIPIFGLTADILKVYVEELRNVDGVLVIQENNITFRVEFVGPNFSNGDQPEFALGPNDCDQIHPSSFNIAISTIQEGIAGFRPHIMSLQTSSMKGIPELMELSYGFDGPYDQVINVNGSLILAKVNAGSKEVQITGSNELGKVFTPSECIKLVDEIVCIESIQNGSIHLNEYHQKGSNNEYVQTYRMVNHIGVASLIGNDDKLVRTQGEPFRQLLQIDDVIKLVDERGGEIFSQIVGFSGEEVILDSVFRGETTAVTVFKEYSIFLNADVSSLQMKYALEEIPSVGVVDVERFGPINESDYVWNVSFMSGLSRICSSRKQCLNIKASTLNCIKVSNVTAKSEDTYFNIGFKNGFPNYSSIQTGNMVYFDGSRWVLGNENGAVIVSAEIDISPATNVTWPSDINVTRYNSAIDIFNEGNVEVISIQNETTPEFGENSILQYQDSGDPEIQEISLEWTGPISGMFSLYFMDPDQEVVINWNEKAPDLATKLSSLPFVGSVQVSEQPRDTQQVWRITFTSTFNDIPLLSIRERNFIGMDVVARVTEIRKGQPPLLLSIFEDLSPERTYHFQMFSENNFGTGLSTSESLNPVMIPLSERPCNVPHAPKIIESYALSDSQIAVKFFDEKYSGSPVFRYIIEWSRKNTTR